LYAKYRQNSDKKYRTMYLLPKRARNAVLTLLTNNRSAPFMIMQKKIAVLLPAESGM
jgi:hypothetical protein